MAELASKLKVDRKASIAIVEQLVNQISDMIESGDLLADTRLPSAMALSKDLGVAYRTVELAFRDLAENGYIHRTRRGSFARFPLKKVVRNNITGASRKFAVLFLDESQRKDLFKQKVLKGINDVLKPPQFDIDILCISDFEKKSQKWWDELADNSEYDGLVIAKEGVMDSQCQEFAQKAKMPFVLFGSMLWSFYHECLTVLPDYGHGIYQVVNHFVELGHSRISLLVGDRALRPAFIKEQCFRDALAQSKMEIDDALIKVGVAGTKESVVNYLDELLGQENVPTAIICGNDATAYYVIMELQARGLDVPGDISVCGYNDYDICSIVSPAITSVQVPMREMGCLVAENLLQHFTEDKPSGIVHVPVELIARESTGPAKE